MKTLIVAGLALLLVLYQIGSAPSEQAAQASAAAPAANDREQFAVDLLAALGNTAPTAETVAMVVEWTIAEDGSAGALARNNPLNTTICGHNWTGAINADGACGVGSYGSEQDGVDAARDTLLQANFSAITAALQANDPEAAKQALWASGWAESHYSGGAGWPHYAMAAQSSPQAAPAGTYASTPIGLDGDCGWNVSAALNANGGALQHVTLAPGETFSFNAALGDPALVGYRTCAGLPGGNWCNLAARYSQVARAMGLAPVFLHHNQDLGAGIENDVLIWNIGGVAGFEGGRQDLLIENTVSRPIVFVAQSDGAAVTIEGGF